ncbi:MAG TPA: hypothetical protein VJA21_19420 [Verrucomicrobiae bacterium]
MRKRISLLLVPLVCLTGRSQHLTFQFGTPFQRTDLDVRWSLTSNELPRIAWVYRLSPQYFSPVAVSKLAGLGGFTDKDILRSNASEITFKKPDYAHFTVLASLGLIEFSPSQPIYSATNLATNVPSLSHLAGLTTNLLGELGINVTDIEKQPDGSPNFHLSQPFTVYGNHGKFVTNIAFRAVSFRRAVDGASVVGNGAGGDCYIQFGENNKPVKISLSWRNLERYKAYETASQETITKWIRHGKAVQGRIRMDAEPIDWKEVKSITITSAKLCYYGGSGDNPSEWFIPFVALWATVDRGHATIDVEIDCPIIDEARK